MFIRLKDVDFVAREVDAEKLQLGSGVKDQCLSYVKPLIRVNSC